MEELRFLKRQINLLHDALNHVNQGRPEFRQNILVSLRKLVGTNRNKGNGVLFKIFKGSIPVDWLKHFRIQRPLPSNLLNGLQISLGLHCKEKRIQEIHDLESSLNCLFVYGNNDNGSGTQIPLCQYINEMAGKSEMGAHVVDDMPSWIDIQSKIEIMGTSVETDFIFKLGCVIKESMVCVLSELLKKYLSQDKIQERAYELFEARGCVLGHELDDWLKAEEEIGMKVFNEL
jgi:hypothetical protein